ncbi:MAG TPA: phosphotransferase [Acidimicrobiia bacterium]|nr:phosphotransferase [Acidimicrobiia bacterium]
MKPGRLLASGRDGDIFEYGPNLVLRKTRDGRSIAHEARIMEYVAEHGYPVPAIEEVRADGTEIVMERVDGPQMLDTGAAALVRLPRMLRTLADLHDQLHEIPAPPWLERALGKGDRLLHLDLHPLNVLMSPTRGPVVIDWPNASRGDPQLDVAMTYALLTCPRIPVPRLLEVALDAIRVGATNRFFARRYRGPSFADAVAFAAELKALDVNMAPDEVARLLRLAQHPRGRRGWSPLHRAR